MLRSKLVENELEPTGEEFAEISLNLDDWDDATLHTVFRKYIETNMSPASLSKFDSVLGAREDVTLDEAVATAMFNEIVLLALVADIERRRDPITPFDI
jgi:hypothetical protein